MHGRVEHGSATTSADHGNNLLRALRPADADLLNPLLEPWAGIRGDVLYSPGDDVQLVYFPCGPAMISYVVVLQSGLSVETALIGREGAVGGIVSRGRLPAFARAEIQFPGSFLRMPVAQLEAAKLRSPSLGQLFSRYADCMMAQVFQGVACNAAHSIEQRTAKWLLAAVERTGTTTIPLTQDQLATMLAVGRSYISRVIGSFKRRGILGVRRGYLVVESLDELRAIACECNESVKEHFDQVLRGVYPAEEPIEK